MSTAIILNPFTGELEFITSSSGPVIGDHKVLASATDTTPGYLLGKLAAGSGISLALLNGGGDEDVQISASGASSANKAMTAEATTADHDEACATAIAATPANYVGVDVNGLWVVVGNGDRTHDCYFSGDAGATARAFGAIVSGDKLYWNGSIALFQLAASDKISFHF